MQVALNNAPEGNSFDSPLFPSFLLFKPSCLCLIKPNLIIARSASYSFSDNP